MSMNLGGGGVGPEKAADEKIQALCNKVKLAAETMAEENFSEFKAISYRDQVVAGENYFIKVYVGGSSYVELFVFQSLPNEGSTVKLLGIKTGIAPIEPIPPGPSK